MLLILACGLFQLPVDWFSTLTTSAVVMIVIKFSVTLLSILFSDYLRRRKVRTMEFTLAGEASTPSPSCSPMRPSQSTRIGGSPPEATTMSSLDCGRPESSTPFPLEQYDSLSVTVCSSLSSSAACGDGPSSSDGVNASHPYASFASGMSRFVRVASWIYVC